MDTLHAKYEAVVLIKKSTSMFSQGAKLGNAVVGKDTVV
jgi:hypothetical protein